VRTSTVVLRRGLLLAAGPTLLTGVFCAVGGMNLGSSRTAKLNEATAAGELAVWLHLPAFAATAACCWAAIETWPLLSRDRPGRDHVSRICRGPLNGSGAAVVGALTALALWLLPLMLAAGMLAPQPSAHVAAEPDREPLLAANGDEITFSLPSTEAKELRLRPAALFLPGSGLAATQLEVRVGGVVVEKAVAIAQTGQLVRITLEPQTVDRITVRRVAGDLPLLFTQGAVEAVEARSRNGMLNGALAVATWILPAAVTMALVVLLGRWLAMPVVVALAFSSLLLQTLGGLGPTSTAMALALRGRWLMAETLYPPCLGSTAVVAATLVLATLLQRRRG
jgi:cytochrome c-type biogenesis protein CcmE